MSEEETPTPQDASTWPECFIVSPIGHPGTPGRKRADAFLKFIAEPVLTELHYQAVRADMIAEPGVVTSQIVRHLIEDPLVIADLTDHNPNVMYELAIRHAAQKPFVQLIDKDQTIPFDVGQQRTIFYDITDLFSVDDCKQLLRKHIELALKPDFVPETPVSRMLDIGKLSSGTKDDAIAQLMAKFDSLAARMSDRVPIRRARPADTDRYYETVISGERSINRVAQSLYRDLSGEGGRLDRARSYLKTLESVDPSRAKELHRLITDLHNEARTNKSES